MKMTMIVIVVLGLMAALAAAVLVQVLTAPAKPAANSAVEAEVEVLVATRALPAMKVVESSAVAAKKVPRSAAPAKALTSSVQVVGKVLIVAVVEGEAFTESNFTRDGSGVNLAASLPPGKRAVSVTLNDSTGMVGLLYAGSVVDVMVSVSAQPGGAGQGQGESITRTLLQGVQVLAIGQESVASERAVVTKGVGGTGVGGVGAGGKGDQRMVTLMVDQRQAQELQLASQRGTLSLSMRNPLDQDRAPMRSTRLVDLSGQPVDKPATATFASSILQTMMTNMQAARNQRRAPAPEAAPQAKAEARPRLWETMIVRGEKSEVRTFPMPELEQKAMTGPVEVE